MWPSPATHRTRERHRPAAGRRAAAGAEAEALAARLEASGYRIVDPGAEASGVEGPDLVVLAASEAHRIPELRQRFGAVPLLLDGGRDDLEARSRCLSSGADDFWLSGLGPSDLLMRLRLHRDIRRRTGQPPLLLQAAISASTPPTAS
ncbi:hypothetical protein [Synechococcus sp. GFB01]|uniref:hypothetical protein n=1 Tax=Synechococcus sp. GFB01 TaxID=1662190 RepID=UPI000AEA5101